jgi:uncharacterized protein (TIGR03492 family)
MSYRPRLLFISNGYGEDNVAAHLASTFGARLPGAVLRGFPMVGKGSFYTEMGVDLSGRGAELPSEGFVRSVRDFTKDVKHGFFSETLGLGKRLRKTVRDFDFLVLVGDAYLLLFVSLFTPHPAGKKIFVNIQTSEWYGSHKPFKQHYSFVERLWTRYCSKLVYVRDRKTLEFLLGKGIEQARCCGNPMMDCFTLHDRRVLPDRRSIIGVLPGSKQEAYENLHVVFDVVRILSKKDHIYDYALALSPNLNVDRIVREHGLKSASDNQRSPYARFSLENCPSDIYISQEIFGNILHESEAVIGTSGTGNEQAAGLGKPVFGFWGRGPQITEKFMKAQNRLLGPSLILSPPDPELISRRMIELLRDDERLSSIRQNGLERMAGRGSVSCMVEEMLDFMRSMQRMQGMQSMQRM